jgi:biotin transport system substrate-specific component
MSSAPEHEPIALTTSDAPSDTTPDAPPAPVARSSVATDIALIATFAAFIAVCALVPAIPTGTPVPITLQTFGVILAGLVLGWRRGALAVLLYLAVGLAGVPVFAEFTGGVAVLSKPSVGYLLAFPFAAALAGFLAGYALRVPTAWRYVGLFLSGLVASILTIHVGGIIGLHLTLGLSYHEAFVFDLKYWPGDIAKNLLAAGVALAVFRAYPDLLRNRR